MGVIDRLSRERYCPEFSSVVIRDGCFEGSAEPGGDEPPLLDEHAGPLWGTVGRAGAGWLQLDASDADQRVLLEAHDGEPGPETEPWRDVLETPYLCRTGTIGLTSSTDGPARTGIRLGGPGPYRARVCRRPIAEQDDGAGYEWAVRFWPAPVRPPAWPARDPDRTARGSLADDIYALASWSPEGRLATTVGGLARTLLAGRSEVREALADSDNLAVTGRMRLTVRALSDEDVEEEPAPVAATTGPPPRPGYLTGTSPILLLRGDRVVPLTRSPVGTPSAMIEYDGGVVVVGSGRAVALRWDGHMTNLGNHLPPDLTLSRDGRTLAAQEWWEGADPYRRLPVYDLAGEHRHTVPWPEDREFDVRILGADGLTVWFRSGGEDLTWTAGDPAPVPAGGPPPSAGWEGPAAPRHPYYRSPAPGRSVAAGDDGRLTVTDDGRTRTYPLPPGARTFGEARPVWESPDHLLLPVQKDPDLGDYLLRIDVSTGDRQIAANECVFALIWPWPHRPPGAGPPPLPPPESGPELRLTFIG